MPHRKKLPQYKTGKCEKCEYEGIIWLYGSKGYLCEDCFCPPMDKLRLEDFVYRIDAPFEYGIVI